MLQVSDPNPRPEREPWSLNPNDSLLRLPGRSSSTLCCFTGSYTHLDTMVWSSSADIVEHFLAASGAGASSHAKQSHGNREGLPLCPECLQ